MAAQFAGARVKTRLNRPPFAILLKPWRREVTRPVCRGERTMQGHHAATFGPHGIAEIGQPYGNPLPSGALHRPETAGESTKSAPNAAERTELPRGFRLQTNKSTSCGAVTERMW